MKNIFGILFALSLYGCQSTGVIPMDRDTFMIGKKDITPGLGVSLSNKAEVYKEATTFCNSKGLEVLALHESVIPAMPGQLGSTEVQFKCVASANDFNLCFQQIKNNPQLNIISSKLSLDSVSEQTFAMLTNTNKPNEAEKAAISLFADLRKNCFKEYDKSQFNTPLAIKSIDNSAISAIENLLVMLYNDKLTYGEFSKARQEIANARDSAIVEIDKELRTNAANAHARAEQIAIQRTAAIAAMQNANAGIQNSIANQNAAEALKNQALKIEFSNASPNVHCTSQKLLNVVNTDCR